MARALCGFTLLFFAHIAPVSATELSLPVTVQRELIARLKDDDSDVRMQARADLKESGELAGEIQSEVVAIVGDHSFSRDIRMDSISVLSDSVTRPTRVLCLDLIQVVGSDSEPATLRAKVIGFFGTKSAVAVAGPEIEDALENLASDAECDRDVRVSAATVLLSNQIRSPDENSGAFARVRRGFLNESEGTLFSLPLVSGLDLGGVRDGTKPVLSVEPIPHLSLFDESALAEVGTVAVLVASDELEADWVRLHALETFWSFALQAKLAGIDTHQIGKASAHKLASLLKDQSLDDVARQEVAIGLEVLAGEAGPAIPVLIEIVADESLSANTRRAAERVLHSIAPNEAKNVRLLVPGKSKKLGIPDE